MRTLPSALIVFAGVALSACAPNDGDVGLSKPYALTSTAPELAAFASPDHPVLLRYEDQWVPLRCDGRTYRDDDLVTVRIHWDCDYLDLNGQALGPGGAWEGALRDEDGDGVFTGSLFVMPLNSNRTALDPAAANAFPFTMTPL